MSPEQGANITTDIAQPRLDVGGLGEVYVHPELAPLLPTLPPARSIFDDIAATRASALARMKARPKADASGIGVELHEIEGRDGNQIAVDLYRPQSATGPLPGVLYFHGGGFAFGRSERGDDRTALEICRRTEAVTLAVQYRLSPENPYPAGLEDGYAALVWAAAQAPRLGIDPGRLAVTGKSAGGCLSAAVALLTRDRGGPPLAFQSLYVPALDDRQITRSSRAITDPRIENSPAGRRVWDHYLGGLKEIPAYAAPARATELTRLPPAYILVCGLDPLHDEGVDYARRLAAAGVPVTLREVPGAWHYFEATAPQSALAREVTAHWLGTLRLALQGG